MKHEHEDKLAKAWSLSLGEHTFLRWLILESERNHNKSVQMAGDLGEALSRIGELEAKLKDYEK